MISKSDIERLIAKQQIDEDDVMFLRNNMYGDDHKISTKEADVFFRLNDDCDGKCDAWSKLFVEAVTDHIVLQTEPKGYVASDQADWLIDRISKSGIVKSATELELLIKVMETANLVPDALELFAMDQVKRAVLSGEGITRSGESLIPGKITQAEVEVLRRILYARAGNDSTAVSRPEAQMLFDINDAVEDTSKDPAWADLFVKAVANYLMALRGFQPPSRKEALRREAWLDDTSIDISGFFGRILSGALRGAMGGYRKNDDTLAPSKESQIAIAETVTEDEANWLVDRIESNSTIDGAEKALLMFIDKEATDVHPRLKPLIDKVA